MTDPLQPGQAPQPGSPTAPATPAAGEPPTPGYEPLEPGTFAPAHAVARDGAAFSGTSGRPSRVRWAIALVGVALVVGITAAIVALASGRPDASIAVGYMPDDTVQYSEYRFDLPGDQRQKVASFLSAFPGFDDQAAIDTKLDETFDRIVAAVSSGEQTYTADIEPWFGGQVAMGSGPIALGDGGFSTFGMMGGPQAVLVVSVKDQTLAANWVAETAGDELTRTQYNGAVLFSAPSDFGPGFSLAINDEVMIAGLDAAVRAAVDTNGDGRLADDAEFRAALNVATRDYVLFTFSDNRALFSSYLELFNQRGAGDPQAMTIANEALSLVPAWIATYGRFESDALAFDTAQPSVDLGIELSNGPSALLGAAPPTTIAYAEVHGVGAALSAVVGRFRAYPELDDAIRQAESTIGMGLDAIYGWWGDMALVLDQDEAGVFGGGLLIAPTDAAAAERLFQVLRSLLVFGGADAGVEIRDVPHGDATITVVDFGEAAGASVDELPPGYKPEIAYAVTPELVVIGYGQAFVESVLDAGPGPSLADDARVSGLLDRVAEENLGFAFLDVRSIREALEPLLREDMSADEWAYYETEIKPFLLPFDALAGSVRRDGDLDRGSSVITVIKP
ncbi:MAG TPA: DUF3352 domain-containing protein [Candidatus Limnocylindrales bacterium]|nr:DUF3352 domain-containing protein [Candidatus Limnocylindrales bacterium]